MHSAYVALSVLFTIIVLCMMYIFKRVMSMHFLKYGRRMHNKDSR